MLPLLWPACGGKMKILAFLTDLPVVSAIPLHPVPDFDFDQSLPDGFDL